MLQQTTVPVVIPYYERFLRSFPTLDALARARLADVLAAWSGLGYYRRARHLHAAARLVRKRHAGRFPRRLEEARALPGIGRYTAGAILSIAYGERLPVVDGNVARVLTRLFLPGLRDRAAREKELWRRAEDLVAGAEAPGDLNQALMELGSTVCVPLRPSCPVCPLRRRCRARAQGVEERVPSPRRVARPPLKVAADVAVVTRAGRVLLRRRDDRRLLHGLWELPTLRADGTADGLRLELGPPVATIRHSITYRRLRLRVRPARLLSGSPPRGHRWVRPEDLPRIATSSIVRKALAALANDPTRRADAAILTSRGPDGRAFDRPRRLC